MNIREYQDSDFFKVVGILNEAFPEINIIDNLKSDNDLKLDDMHMQVVALIGDIVVGYALVSRSIDPMIKRTNYWIDYVCVDSNYRGRGIGKQLMFYIEDKAREENVLYLQLTSSRFRTSARRLYTNMGFEVRESDIYRKVL